MKLPRLLRWWVVTSFSVVVAAAVAVSSAAISGLDGGSVIGVAAGLAVATTALGLGLAYYIARRASSSALEIAKGAHRVAEGDMDHRIRSSGVDETADLADAFNAMAARLRQIISEASVEQSRLSAVLNTMADGVIVVGSDRQVSLINRAAEQLLRVGPQAQSSSLAEVIRDHELQQIVSRAIDTQQPQQTEVQILQGRRYIGALATPVAENGTGGVLLTLHDMTKLRQLETTRKEFVTNVSHELRNPLASVKVMVETLENGAVDDLPVAQDFLGRIHGEIDRMTDLVNELLELARLESGQATLHLAPFDLSRLLSQSDDYFKSRAEQARIKLMLEVEQDLPSVVGEEQKLRQVMANLLDNALKFTPADGQVAVSARSGGRFVKVSVRDTGPGIAPEHLPHVFERFYKVDRSRRDEGTGLGLAIAKHIVQTHGGDVAIESREGEGSTFTFTVPRAD